MTKIHKTLMGMNIRANRNGSAQGFMLAEVLIASLLTLIFTAIAMQIFVMGTAVKIRAQETSEAANWVEQDIEDIKIQAAQMDYCASTSTDTTCTGISNAYKIDNAKCTANASANGYAYSLQQLRGTTDISKSSILGNRPYVLSRATSFGAVPYNSLKLTYSVYKGTTPTGTPVYQYSSEVIPGVAFSCRSLYPS
jgi:type II secretory pathway pseudopilin PulG